MNTRLQVVATSLSRRVPVVYTFPTTIVKDRSIEVNGRKIMQKNFD